MVQQITCWRLEAVRESEPNDLVARFKSDAKGEAELVKAVAEEILCVEKEIITIFEDAEEFRPQFFDTEAKRRGLAKLTKQEKVALGLEYEDGSNKSTSLSVV